MDLMSDPIFQWLAQYAYQPNVVYMAVFGMMIASGFGFPLPEEVTIVSVGILAYMGGHPEMFPPPALGAPVINGYEAAVVTLVAVVLADFLVFSIGRFFGRKIMCKPRFQSLFGSHMDRISSWVRKFGIYAAFGFRFTPGIRFPAHIALGMTNFPAWQFCLVDGIAAMISVPTQILLIYHFGEPILHILSRFKFYILMIFAIIVAYALIRKFFFSKEDLVPGEEADGT